MNEPGQHGPVEGSRSVAFTRRSRNQKALALAIWRAPDVLVLDSYLDRRPSRIIGASLCRKWDGILAGAPAFNWSKFITSELYPQIVYQRDLSGVPLTGAQLTLVGNAAIAACDVVGGVHLGYIPDPSICTYDPTQDKSVLCTSAGGSNTTADCLSLAQATSQNKIWYGQTADGSVPSPAVDNGFGVDPSANQRWYGLARGAASGLAVLRRFRSRLTVAPRAQPHDRPAPSPTQRETAKIIGSNSMRSSTLISAFRCNRNSPTSYGQPHLSSFRSRRQDDPYHGSATSIPTQGWITTTPRRTLMGGWQDSLSLLSHPECHMHSAMERLIPTLTRRRQRPPNSITQSRLCGGRE
jgi:hypothetical protein